MKRINNEADLAEMDVKEFQIAVRNAKLIPLSPNAIFMQGLNGYDLFYHDEKRFKWEILALGYKDYNKILEGRTPITAVKREKVLNFLPC